MAGRKEPRSGDGNENSLGAPKLKRRRRGAGSGLSREQVLEGLRQAELRAAVTGGGAWLAVSPAIQRLLDLACFGSVDGGTGTASETAALLGQPLVCNPTPTLDPGAEVMQKGRCGMQEAEEIQQAGGDALDDKELVATGQPPPELVSIRLSLEEALFMLWGHRILRAFDADRGSALAELSPEGFFPRSGLQYGADLVIYRRHPSLCHSDACVRIISTEAGKTHEMLQWHDLSATARLCTAVSKGLLLLFVHQLPGADLASLVCLNRFQVREMKFTRWVPGLDDTKNNRKLEAAANTTAKKRIGGSAQPSGVLS